MEKREYVEPVMELVEMETEDIILASNEFDTDIDFGGM